MVELSFQPLTPERWEDFERLFGPKGAYGGCWCMWWRTTRSQFEQDQGAGNRNAMREIVEGGRIPGILAYEEGEPVGWCSVAPREHYGSLNRSRVLKPIDDTPVWSMVCFYIPKKHQQRGLLLELIKGGVRYAVEQGAAVIEAYPTVPRGGRLPPVSSFMGIPATFKQAGFVEVARPSESKAILRHMVAESAQDKRT